MSVLCLLVGAAGVVFGASLVGTWAVGVVVIAMSGMLGAWGLLRDDGRSDEPKPEQLAASRSRIRARARDAA